MSPIEVRNPRTGKLDYVIIPPPSKLLAQKCNRLRRGQLLWQNLDLEGRVEALQAFKQGIFENRAKLLDALVADTGRLFLSELEIDTLIAHIERCCYLAHKLIRDRDLDTGVSYIHLWQTASPYQLVGIISPYTFPLLLAVSDGIPALLAGCAVAIKPSELTPRFIAPLTAVLNEIPLLRDVLAFVEGNGETGTTLIECVDLVCFTGSLETGRQVVETAAAQFIPAHLELGGKNAAIVLESADLDLTTSAILWGAATNSGQSCTAISRIYVAQAIFEDFYHQLIAKANNLKFAHPQAKDGELGPIINYKQVEVIRTRLQQASSLGAIIHCGGEVEKIDGGLWLGPTVMTQVNSGMEILTEETLAPIMPVSAIASPEEGINLANDSVYGRSASVFTTDEEEAMAVARQLEVGTVTINDVVSLRFGEAERQPFKFSGLGLSRYSANVFSRFLRSQAIFRKVKPIPSSWWFNS